MPVMPLTGKITLRSENGGERVFTILEFLGRGGSTFSYKAYPDEYAPGVLKEFCPNHFTQLERNSEGQIILPSEFQQEFLRSRDEYVWPYIELMNLMHNPEHEKLGGFIPSFEIYYGDDTAYIWTSRRNDYSFDRFCNILRKHPSIDTKYRLLQVFIGIKSFTECVAELHKLSLLNLDINPANFGFGFINIDNPIMQNPSMFDVNTIKSIAEAQLEGETFGTEGYIEPDNFLPSVQSDIYSIGAVLFHAIITSENIYDYEEHFEKLYELVNSSKIIQSAGLSDDLKNKISELLKGCLSLRPERYKGCEEVISAIDEIITFKDFEQVYNSRYAEDEYTAKLMRMQYHLYKHTLYEHLHEENIIKVFVYGFNIYGQRFLDACLQMGQIPGKSLEIKVFCSDYEKEEYLNNRPEFQNFFNIDNQRDNDNEVYGKINFIHNLNELNMNPCYIFVSIGENNADILSNAEILQQTYTDCSINFLQTGDMPNDKQDFHGLNPVYADEDFEDPEIDRMAFNAHLIWEKGWGTSHQKVLERFRTAYNHNSSVSNVLSLKSKLFSLGIDLDKMNYVEAAAQCRNNINQNRNQLICCEHKRWVIEKICEGWRKKEVNSCNSNAGRQDKNAKLHVCIVRSRANQNLLNSNIWQDKVASWNNSDIVPENNNLDELDSMSVNLHRHFLELAKSFDKVSFYNAASQIKAKLIDFPEIAASFEELYSCMNDIADGEHAEKAQTVREKVYMYEEKLKKIFEDKLNDIQESSKKKELLTLNNNLTTLFSSTLESMRFTDFKHEDTVLIDNIPFILTYRTDINLVVPLFSDFHDNTRFFNNIASALLINPQKITYVSASGIHVKEAFSKLQKFASNKKLRAEVELLIVNNEAEINKITADMNTDNTVIDKNGSNMFSDYVNRFNFNSATMNFEDTEGFSRIFRYIKKRPSMTIANVISDFSNVASYKDNPCEFFEDYKTLWQLYSNQTYNYTWKKLTQALKNYTETNDVVATLRISNAQSHSYVYVLPFECRYTADKIIRELCEAGIIENSSHVEGFNVSSCRVKIQDIGNHKELFDKIFSDQEKLKCTDYYKIYPIYNNHNVLVAVGIKYNDLKVQNCFVLDELEEDYDIDTFLHKVRFILTTLNEMGYIFAHSVNDNGYVSLTFATPQIKDLLTSAGRMLEVFIYHEVKKSSKIDDVKSSLDCWWSENPNDKNELDCVITKGFKTIIIECKARYRLDTQAYDDFDVSSKKFGGVNTKRVLVSDYGGHMNDLENVFSRNYGLNNGIATIFEPAEIQNIVKTLSK